jgi:saccharopine dehydrogenase-like NADP-dependent oxidoreductase
VAAGYTNTWNGGTDFATATPVDLTTASQVVNVSLTTSRTVSGTVTGNAGVALPGSYVHVFDATGAWVSYQVADAEETMARFGLQPVGWQTGFNPVVAMELIADGTWSGSGVRSAESFDPDPYLAILDRDGIHHATIEIEPGRAVA